MKNTLVVMTTLCLFSHTLASLDKRYFIPFGEENGDEILIDVSASIGTQQSDDGSFQIQVEHIPVLDLINNTKIQISPNGFIALFDLPYDNPDPEPFPRLLYPGKSAPQIDVFHTDLLFTNHMMSKLSYQIHTGGPALDQVQSDILHLFRRQFTPTRVFTVTWRYAEPFNAQLSFEQNATFQLALATNEQETYLFLHYGELNIKEFSPTTVGWQEYDPSKFFLHPLSQLAQDENDGTMNRPIRLQNESNVGIPGKWIYRVAKPYAEEMIITEPTRTPIQLPTCPISSSNVCTGKYGNIAFPGQPNFFISCAAGHKPVCQPCPIGTSFVEECNQCLGPQDTECVSTHPAVTQPLPTVPYGGCTAEKAREYCTGKTSGRYANPNDNTDQSFFWCYSIGAVCQHCARGTVFCPTSPKSGVCK